MVRVIIDRHFTKGMRATLLPIETKARHEALCRSGYVSGESLQDVDDPQHNIVISSWRSKEDWKAWSDSSTRRELAAQIAPLLDQAEIITVFNMP